ncbi:MAG: quaternary ammonium compound efflux SMR transporter SugE [Gemmatimonadota bacterium]|jgi:quaternary ammonium compound-resistance protein SugE|nr:quaternary ammonium compound efflux SMR transporter SugE [Gemmatimonadota bacterium]
MAWVLLVIAGFLEVVWAVGLKYSDGFTRLMPSLITAVGLVLSMLLLSFAVRTIPIGTAYPVWVGIGAVGAALVGMLVLGEPYSAPKLFFLVLLIAGIVGLRATASG